MATLSKNANFHAWHPTLRNTCFQSCQLILSVSNTNAWLHQYRGGRGRGSSRSSAWPICICNLSSHSTQSWYLFDIFHHSIPSSTTFWPILFFWSYKPSVIFIPSSNSLSLTSPWGQCSLWWLAVMLAALASIENASMMQDWLAVCNPVAPSSRH